MSTWETVLIDCYDCGCCPADKDRIERLCIQAARDAGMHPYDTAGYAFDEHTWREMYGASGLTLVVPLRESHLAVHTFPAMRRVVIDLTTCGDGPKAKAAAHALAGVFKPGRVIPHYIPRCAEEAD